MVVVRLFLILSRRIDVNQMRELTMKTSSIDDQNDDDKENADIRLMKFLLIILLEPISLILNLILIVYLLKDRKLVENLHQHVILCLLIVSFLTNSIEIPRILDYLRLGEVKPSTTLSCLIWQWCDYLFFAQSNLLMFWASFQRHFLVFNSKIFLRRKIRYFCHYFPLMIIPIYLILFYWFVIFVYPCERNIDYHQPLCGSPCFNSNKFLSFYDLFVHSWIPIILIGFSSLTLILRVFYRQRLFQGQTIQWRRYRRMIVQLLFISSIYLICLGPYTLIQIIDLIVDLPPIAKHIQTAHLFYLYWFLTLIFPFVTIYSLPEFKEKFFKFFLKIFQKRNFISPISFQQ